MTQEQAALLKKAQDSLQAARLLFDKEYYDFAVSRSYYSMFYLAEMFLLGEGLSFSKHSAVIAAFGQHFVKTGRVPHEFHRYLIEGEDSRNVGDYDINQGLSSEDALEQIKHADKTRREFFGIGRTTNYLMSLSLLIQESLRNIKDQSTFINALLSDALRWPIEGKVESLDDISYDWTAEDLLAGEIDEKVVDGRIWQIQPLVSDQPRQRSEQPSPLVQT